jgi:energy-coupling factor transporter transmembrane protein EcfT
VRRHLARAWLVVPLFTLLVALPATLNLVTPGPELVGLGTWFGHPVTITAPGVAGAARLVARTGASISLVVLLTLTTPWHALLRGLGQLRVPAAFVAVVAMAWRYVFVLSATVTDLFVARRARGAGATRGREAARRGRGVVAGTAATTLARSHQLSTEVHDAMVARGWTGHVRTLDPGRLTRIDLAIVGAAIAAAALTVGLDRALTG